MIEAEFESLIILTMTEWIEDNDMSKISIKAIIQFGNQINQDTFKTQWESIFLQNNNLNEIIDLGNSDIQGNMHILN